MPFNFLLRTLYHIESTVSNTHFFSIQKHREREGEEGKRKKGEKRDREKKKKKKKCEIEREYRQKASKLVITGLSLSLTRCIQLRDSVFAVSS